MNQDCCHVLLIDDDEDDYLLTRAMLKQVQGRKIRLEWISGFKTGLEKVLAGFCQHGNRYDAVLVDYDLGRSTGIDLIRQAIQAGATVPFIVITGRSTLELDLEARKAGAGAFVPKSQISPILLERSISFAIEKKQAELAIRASEQRFRQLAESLPQLVWTCNARGECDYLSPQWVEYTGISASEQLGDTWLKQVHPQDRERVVLAWGQAVQSHTPFDIEFRIRRADGAYRWFKTLAKPIEDDQGRLVRWFGSNTDITEIETTRRSVENQRAQLSAIIHTLPVGISLLNEHGELIESNPMAEQFWSAEPGERLLARPTAGEPGPAGQIGQMITHVLETGEGIFSQELSLPHPDGSQDQVLVSAAPIHHPSGSLIGAVVATINVRKQKDVEAQLKSTEEKARNLIRYAPTAIYEIDLQTRKLIEVNDVMCTYLGYSREELLEMDSASLLAEDSRKTFLDRIRCSLAGEEVDDSVEYKVRAKDGRELYAVLKTTLTLKDGRPATAMVIAHDVTERRQIERALKAQNERLQSYASQLRRSNQLLADFAFNASHDLQEPLRKIQAFGELLVKGSASLLDEQSRDYITRMQGAAVRMRDLLTGLLEYSRVVNQENPFTQVDLNEIVADVLEDLEILLASTEGQVALEKLPTLEADPIQMRELFQNLIGNALKFHRPGSSPQVNIRVEEQSGEAVTIIVADNGIGIDAHNLEAVFLPFKRLNTKLSYEGSGMGLAISRKIVERHEGSLSVDSAIEQGATFRVRLPVRQLSG